MLTYLAPFVGAIALEVFHWYQLREKLEHIRYQKLLRSKMYWIFTFLAILLGGLGALIYFGSRLSPGELLVAGAAFPTLLKKLVSSFTAKQETKLGEPDEASHPARDYFAFS